MCIWYVRLSRRALSLISRYQLSGENAMVSINKVFVRGIDAKDFISQVHRVKILLQCTKNRSYSTKSNTDEEYERFSYFSIKIFSYLRLDAMVKSAWANIMRSFFASGEKRRRVMSGLQGGVREHDSSELVCEVRSPWFLAITTAGPHERQHSWISINRRTFSFLRDLDSGDGGSAALYRSAVRVLSASLVDEWFYGLPTSPALLSSAYYWPPRATDIPLAVTSLISRHVM